jgi:CubicO group peptidase (beta-lactamase class C family)
MLWLVAAALAADDLEVTDVLPPPLISSCPELPRWPAPDWADATAAAPAGEVAALDALLFPPGLDRTDKPRADKYRAGVRTDGVAIVHRGELVYERYAGGYDRDRPHLAWSATKTFTSALVGIAVSEGLLSLDDSICDHLQIADAHPASCAVRVRDLLAFASGFDWHETYEGASPRTSSVLAMLYGEGRRDMAAFTVGLPLRDPPGTSYMYSSGDTNVLAAIAGAVLAPAHGERFPWAVLLEPIGITSAVWERDGVGTYVGSSYLYATPRDLARFGYLLLGDGCWQDDRLLPDGWLAASTEPSAAFRAKPLDRDPGDVQGQQIWLNRRVPEQGQTELPWPGVPEDAYAARGHWGQAIAVIPSKELVVVRTADDRDGTFEFAELLRRAIALADAR